MKRFAICLLASLIPGAAHSQCDITQKVCAPADSYDPDPAHNNTNNTSPVCDNSKHVNASAIQMAFNSATTQVKSDLCLLHNIFISSVPHGWGRYNDPTYHPHDNPGATYIAIDARDQAKHIADKQADHMKALSPGAASKITHTSSGTGSSDNRLGLLYVLAHGLGHIKWHDELYPLSGTQPGIPCFDAQIRAFMAEYGCS